MRPGRTGPTHRPQRAGFGFGAEPGSGSAGAPWLRTPIVPPPSGLLGEGEELVAGRHPVEEAFLAHRKAVRLLVVPQRRQALEKLVLHATSLRIPIIEVEGGTLTSLAGFDGHQGIALVTDLRQFASLGDILARAIERAEPPFVLVLDSLEDPQNFGSLLRTAEASGVHGVVYPVRRQAPLSAAAVKASAGAVEHLLLVPVDDLAEALTDLHVRGLRIIGSDADASLTARQADLRGPLAVVVGSEGQGLGPAVRRRCDAIVRIPMRGHVGSLNAAVAGSILVYEASSQRGGDRSQLASGISGQLATRAPELALHGSGAASDNVAPGEPAPGAIEPAPSFPTLESTTTEAAPTPPAKSRRRKVAGRGTAEAAEPQDDALLPGHATIDSSDASPAE